MPDEHDDRLRDIARELKRPVPVNDAFNTRVMRAIRRLPRHAESRIWSRLTTPRRITVTPLTWGLLAAGLVLAVALGVRPVVRGATNAAKPITTTLFPATKKTEAPKAVQFVLVAPEAKKVAVVGDFNGWDVSHESYQAEHRGGGVWAVTAAVPAGHHRYSFVVDDSLWIADPRAPRALDADFGVTNSAIVVQNNE